MKCQWDWTLTGQGAGPRGGSRLPPQRPRLRKRCARGHRDGRRGSGATGGHGAQRMVPGRVRFGFWGDLQTVEICGVLGWCYGGFFSEKDGSDPILDDFVPARCLTVCYGIDGPFSWMIYDDLLNQRVTRWVLFLSGDFHLSGVGGTVAWYLAHLYYRPLHFLSLTGKGVPICVINLGTIAINQDEWVCLVECAW